MPTLLKFFLQSFLDSNIIQLIVKIHCSVLKYLYSGCRATVWYNYNQLERTISNLRTVLLDKEQVLFREGWPPKILFPPKICQFETRKGLKKDSKVWL